MTSSECDRSDLHLGESSGVVVVRDVVSVSSQPAQALTVGGVPPQAVQVGCMAGVVPVQEYILENASLKNIFFC